MMPYARRLTPTVTSMIRMDHTHVLATFHQYSAYQPQDTKQALANVVCRAVEIHGQLEEEIFYPALRAIVPDESTLGKSTPEHDEMRHLIAALRASSPESLDFDDLFMQLMRRVLHHVADEETVLLPLAETRLSREQLCELGVQMTKRRLALIRPHVSEVAVNTVRGFSRSPMLWAAGTLLAVGALAKRH